MHHDLRNLMEKYKELARRIGASSSIDLLLTSTNLSYSAEIMVMSFPPKFKMLQVEIYNGFKDPVQHLEKFKTHMTLHNFPREIACWTFPLSKEQ